ncbi:putative MATE family efflux protein [Lachnotalea glycerini]|uniref:Probable multidrug resistance protein NorM n=1 Tax=Lachnotalea glycerini TaxID=1763509 RepID=A0A318ETB1_9FIRM|nr:MATE family efflux transporter [Lachnotalea glycerini]PXV96149.1 putative MATE family efflux protein [Lachnotalea glycerini]
MIKDLTEGKPQEVLWKFSIPMFISVIFQQIYNIADSVVAGKFAGEDALAAVGASYPITMIFMAIAIGSNIGCSIVISQFFGAKKYKEVKTAIATTVIASIILAIVLTFAGLFGSKALMLMINTPKNIFTDGALYLRIYIGGFLFLYLYNIATGIFNSLGDSKTPLYFLIASSIGNIFLDLLFVIQFHLGVAGVAWATFIAQGVACLLALISVKKRVMAIKTEGKTQIFSYEMLRKISLIAIPSILQQSFISIGNIFIQSLINGLGSSVIAGYSAAIKLNTFTITSFTTLGNGVSSFCAQNMGAGKYDRVKEGFKAGIKMSMLVAFPFFIAYFIFSNQMLGMFMNSESITALKAGKQFLMIVSPFYFVISIKLIADGILRGAGAMKVFMIATFSDLIIRVVLAYILAPYFGSAGIWTSWPIGWLIGALLSFGFYIKGSWRKGVKIN